MGRYHLDGRKAQRKANPRGHAKEKGTDHVEAGRRLLDGQGTQRRAHQTERDTGTKASFPPPAWKDPGRKSETHHGRAEKKRAQGHGGSVVAAAEGENQDRTRSDD
jgi:hypothetical protein